MTVTNRAPMDWIESETCVILAIAIGRAAPMLPDDDFFAVGGNSVGATLAAMALQDALAVPVSVRDILTWPRPKELAVELRSRVGGEPTPVSGDPGRILCLPHEADAALLRFASRDDLARVDPYISTPARHDLDRYLAIPTLAEHVFDTLPAPDAVEVVIGYCSATPLAYELARRCAVTSGTAPRVLLVTPTIGAMDVVSLQTLLGTHQPHDWMGGLLPLVPPALRADFPEPSVVLSEPDALYPYLVAMVREHITDLVGLPEPPASPAVRQRLTDIHVAHVRDRLAAARYEYQPTDLDVTVLVASDDERRQAFWRGFRPEVRVVTAPLHHEELMMSPTTWRLVDDSGADRRGLAERVL